MDYQNEDYVALKLMEILFERGLVNKETLDAVKEKSKCVANTTRT